MSNEPNQRDNAKMMRIDAAHEPHMAESPAAAGVPAEAVSTENALQLQAEQLAERLQTQKVDLDRREAQFHAHLARTDNEIRSTRLWFEERTRELDDFRQRLDLREQELDERAMLIEADAHGRLSRFRQQEKELESERRQLEMDRQAVSEATAAAEALQLAVAQARHDFDQRRAQAESAMVLKRQQLDHRRAASLELVRLLRRGLERHRDALDIHERQISDQSRQPSPQQRRFADELAAREADLERRSRKLVELSAELEQEQAELKQARIHSEIEREAERREIQRQRTRIAEKQAAEQAEIAERKRTLSQLSANLDNRRLALDQMSEDVNRLHREALEMRLVTEELWSRLSRAVPLGTLTESLGKLRSQLAACYQLQIEQLDVRRGELVTLRDNLSEQHARLSQDRQELQNWHLDRQRELSHEAAGLAQRELEVAESQQLLRRQAAEWKEERLSLKQEVRRLHAQLRANGQLASVLETDAVSGGEDQR